MDTILHTPQKRSKEAQQDFDSAIEELRRAITKPQGNASPNYDDPLLDQLDDIDSIFNNLKNDLTDQNKKLTLENERLVLWKRSLVDTIEFISTRVPDQSLRETLKRLHYQIQWWSIHDPLPDPHRIMIGL